MNRSLHIRASLISQEFGGIKYRIHWESTLIIVQKIPYPPMAKEHLSLSLEGIQGRNHYCQHSLLMIDIPSKRYPSDVFFKH